MVMNETAVVIVGQSPGLGNYYIVTLDLDGRFLSSGTWLII